MKVVVLGGRAVVGADEAVAKWVGPVGAGGPGAMLMGRRSPADHGKPEVVNEVVWHQGLNQRAQRTSANDYERSFGGLKNRRVGTVVGELRRPPIKGATPSADVVAR